MPQPASATKKRRINKLPKRNDLLFDTWSIIHFVTGVWFGWIMSPAVALALLIAWEPIENFVISPIMRKFGIIFGYESLRNSLSDIFFDILGVLAGVYIMLRYVPAPFHLF